MRRFAATAAATAAVSQKRLPFTRISHIELHEIHKDELRFNVSRSVLGFLPVYEIGNWTYVRGIEGDRVVEIDSP